MKGVDTAIDELVYGAEIGILEGTGEPLVGSGAVPRIVLEDAAALELEDISELLVAAAEVVWFELVVSGGGTSEELVIDTGGVSVELVAAAEEEFEELLELVATAEEESEELVELVAAAEEESEELGAAEGVSTELVAAAEEESELLELVAAAEELSEELVELVAAAEEESDELVVAVDEGSSDDVDVDVDTVTVYVTSYGTVAVSYSVSTDDELSVTAHGLVVNASIANTLAGAGTAVTGPLFKKHS
jgi:hypothetical protein